MIGIIEDVLTKKFKSAYMEASYDKAKSTIEEKGYRAVSLEEIAYLKIYGDATRVIKNGEKEEKDLSLWENSNWVKEWVVYVPNKGRFITSNLESNGKVIAVYREKGEYFLYKKQVRRALEDAIEIPNNLKSVSTKKFSKSEFLCKLFGRENAIELGYILRGRGIKRFSFKFYSQRDVEIRGRELNKIGEVFAYPLLLKKNVIHGYWDPSLGGKFRGIKNY